MNKNKTRYIAALLALMTLSATAMAACAEKTDDDNPVTGVMLSFSAITIATFTVIFTKKKK